MANGEDKKTVRLWDQIYNFHFFRFFISFQAKFHFVCGNLIHASGNFVAVDRFQIRFQFQSEYMAGVLIFGGSSSGVRCFKNAGEELQNFISFHMTNQQKNFFAGKNQRKKLESKREYYYQKEYNSYRACFGGFSSEIRSLKISGDMLKTKIHIKCHVMSYAKSFKKKKLSGEKNQRKVYAKSQVETTCSAHVM